jgi:excisionase family DNA binding protein
MSETETYTVQQIANILRVDVTTVRRWIKNGALEAEPRNDSREAYQVKKSAIDALLGTSLPAEDSGKSQKA